MGIEEQMVNSGQFPATAFDPTAFDTDVEFKTINVGNKATITVEHVAAAADQSLSIGLIGPAVD